jgi:hypothetical protein
MKQTTEKIAAPMNSIGHNSRDRHPVTDVMVVTVYYVMMRGKATEGNLLWLLASVFCVLWIFSR